MVTPTSKKRALPSPLHRAVSPLLVPKRNTSALISTTTTTTPRLKILDEGEANKNLGWTLERYEDFATRLPMLKKLTENVRRIPSQIRIACFLCWIVYKFATAVIVLYLLHHHVRNVQSGSEAFRQSSQEEQPPLTKILYIVTSLAEYNNGRRNTVAGQDRLGEVVLPILVDSVESMVLDPVYSHNFQVDVVLILAYVLRPDREQMIRDRLPPSTGLEIWDDACPLGYDPKSQNPDAVRDNTRALARQHRYVIKDKLPYYDLFVAFEDDMRITGAHVQHYLDLSETLEVLKRTADASPPPQRTTDPDSFFGPMTKRQLDRLIPGFIRVEVLLNEQEHGAQKVLDPIPLDYTVNCSDENNNRVVHFDARPCCQLQRIHPNGEIPAHPDTAQVVIWETSIKALAVRQLSTVVTTAEAATKTNTKIDWVALLPGPGKRLAPEDLIGSYWSGKLAKGAWDVKPSPGQPDLIAQQGGWMATKEQLWRWNQQNSGEEDDQPQQLCQGTFLPPFDEPVYRRDGQESMNVEL